MTRVLKDKYKKTPKTRVLKKIVKPKPVGRWCEYYSGRLPYAIECSNNKNSPISTLFIEGKPKITRNYPNCKYCKRNVTFTSWKRGDWARIIAAIEAGKDLSDMPAPGTETE